jgi:hypothetical protein
MAMNQSPWAPSEFRISATDEHGISRKKTGGGDHPAWYFSVKFRVHPWLESHLAFSVAAWPRQAIRGSKSLENAGRVVLVAKKVALSN